METDQRLLELQAEAWKSITTHISLCKMTVEDKGNSNDLLFNLDCLIRVAEKHKQVIDKYIDSTEENDS